jgi:hypothetical protein
LPRDCLVRTLRRVKNGEGASQTLAPSPLNLICYRCRAARQATVRPRKKCTMIEITANTNRT